VREGVASGRQGVGGKEVLGRKEDVVGKKVADGKEGNGVGDVGSRPLALDPKIVKVCAPFAGLSCLV
jgi:hypothetical protein